MPMDNLITKFLMSLFFIFTLYNYAVADSYTKLLLHFDGADALTVYTAETGQNVTFSGTAQLDSAQQKFGTTSLLLDGNSDYITLPDSDDWHFGAGDFTIDFWVKFNDISTNQVFLGQFQDSNNRWYCFKSANNKLYMYFVSGGSDKGYYYTSNTWEGISVNTWYHLAFERNGATAKIFINGVSQPLTESVAFGTNNVGVINSTLRIGTLDITENWVNAWIDEFRISKGIARWTSNFTPSSSAYGDISSIESPHMINYQGRLTNISGTLVADGSYPMAFKIYDAETAGTLLWEESQTVVVNKGMFNVLLGAVNNTLAAKLPSQGVYYLEIKTGTEVMTPRQRIASAASALNGVPRGGIIMWSGSVVDIPAGWALCNGSNGTPDLRDKFIVGAKQDSAGVTKTNVTGVLTQTGGEAFHTLTLQELPSHFHSLDGTNGGDIVAAKNGADSIIDSISHEGTANDANYWAGMRTGSVGGGAAHNNLPPYYALAYIMKL